MIGQQATATLLSSVLKLSFDLERSPEELSELLEIPKDVALGDIAFPCFQLAKSLKRPPPMLAAEIAAKVGEAAIAFSEIETVKAAGPYVNFFLNKTALAVAIIPSILSGEFLARRSQQSDRVMVEYGSLNTHKSFHVGHIRNVALGDSVARLFDWSGFDTIRAAYLGDEGTHVAKCLWYVRTHPELEIPATNRLEFFGNAYVQATLQLDLESYTEVPLVNVETARVEAFNEHPNDSAWIVVSLTTSSGPATVVTQRKNAVRLSVGTIVPHARPGAIIGSRPIAVADKKGLQSFGLLLGSSELGIGAGDEVLALEIPARFKTQYPEGIGIEIVELYRKPGTLPDDKAILPTLMEWNRQVSEVLQRLEANDPELKQEWLQSREWSLDELKEDFAWLNSNFDQYFFESQCGEESKQLVREYQKKGVFVESQGAVGANLEAYKLGFCVLIKRDGTVLYATRDLALAQEKFRTFGIDRSIYVVDAAQTLHFQQVFKCLELMGYEQVKKCFHCSYAQVVLPSGKMSSRKGTVVLMSALKDRLLSKIHSEYLDKYQGEWSDEERRDAAHKIALGTIRYGMLNQDNNSLIVFDLDAWTARTGNTGPYMMYAYARTRSILRELGELTIDWKNVDWSLLTHETEIDVLRHLNEYHSTVQQALDRYSPHVVCGYAYELAKRFSRMYQNCSVLHAETPELQRARAGIVLASGAVIKHALGLLGIETVERM